jgi:hypothetical protein
VKRVRFAEDIHPVFQLAVVQGLRRISGDKQDREGGCLHPRSIRKLTAVETGQSNIRDQEVELCPRLDFSQTFRSVRGLFHEAGHLLQHVHNLPSDS